MHMFEAKVNPQLQLSTPTSELTTDNSEVVKLFNKYFSTVFTEEDSTSSPQAHMLYQGTDEGKCIDVKFTEVDIKNLNKL